MEKNMRTEESGFSLVELMVAMAMTLIVSGAIYGLMASGQSAFRREPELADRQQQIRIALDLIQKDIAIAGMNLGPFTQAFTNNLNSFRPGGPSGNTDALQLVGSDGLCPNGVTAPPVAVDYVNTLAEIPSCYPEPGLVFLKYANGQTKLAWGHNIHTVDNKRINLPQAKQPLPPSDITLPATIIVPSQPVEVGLFQLIRYEIANDPVDGMPSLWRSTVGGMDPAGSPPAYVAPPGAAAAGWQLVARGIEDMQVQYRTGVAWADTPGVVNCGANCANPPSAIKAEYDTIVREVRVTLSARVTAARLQGESTAGGVTRVRAQLTSVTTPRGAMFALQQASPSPLAPFWQ